MPPTDVTAEPLPEPYEPFDPFQSGYRFRSPEVRGYRAASSTAGTIIDVPDIEFPGTISSLPRDLLNDQQTLQFQDVIRNSGATVQSGDGQFADPIFIRGLKVNSRDFR